MVQKARPRLITFTLLTPALCSPVARRSLGRAEIEPSSKFHTLNNSLTSLILASAASSFISSNMVNSSSEAVSP